MPPECGSTQTLGVGARAGAVTFTTHPTLCGDALAPRHVDLRVFALGTADPARPVVSPAPLTRVALREGSLVVNSSAGGGSKDTWVLTDG